MSVQPAPSSIRIALAQINPIVGDLAFNRGLIAQAISDATDQGAAVVALPELAMTGYPPEDLLLVPRFLAECEEELQALAKGVTESVALVGAPEVFDGALYNTIAVIGNGGILGRYRKVHLPNYGVFDEARYFSPGNEGKCITVNGVRIGLSICEDIWVAGRPSADCARSGAQAIVNISASPFHAGKGAQREDLLATRSSELGIPIGYCALVGGQDELVFDGGSMVVGPAGATVLKARQFDEELLFWDLDSTSREPDATEVSPSDIAVVSVTPTQSKDETPALIRHSSPLDPVDEIIGALELGLGDYVSKNGFSGVVLGISGGIDSAVTAAIAVRALGSENVHGVVMPSPWSSSQTQQDARDLCSGLGIQTSEVPIKQLMEDYEAALALTVRGDGVALAAENIQARIRGNLLMAMSNEHGWLVLTTGNKSELAVGYSTLYGDAAGGFGVLKDTPKTLVFDIARQLVTKHSIAIPQAIIERPPSAELRPDQLDTDSLPPYDQLDPILRMYVEEHADSRSIVAAGYDEATVQRVLGLIDRAEYKRRQYPPGVKITPLAFGRDRRMPITNRFSR